ncbi:AT-rich interactive domain-containing protein 1-like isoform X2 [Phragmites australis]|uniref:AT-rich interactive domain-containing protein 1-like isoform X2 n=1 Tax=Phragmites australis TaxID=29695 RepID=UPI002D799D15|nr:AT-rich interactive domain-containing protein 1-like isoform X2 [Phragmites australis]
MVGMCHHQLRDDPFGALGGHCSGEPRLATAGASSSSSSAPSSVSASPLAQAHGGGGEPRQLFEALVGGSLVRGAGGGGAGWDLGELVRWMRDLAMDPVAARPAPAEDRARKRQVRALRRARYLRMEDVADTEELPSFAKKRKHKAHNNHWDKQKKKGCMNMPTRKSERLAKRMKLMASLLLTQRKKIGVGEHFQAEVPDWTGQPSGEELSCYRSDSETSKMLGTRIWPPEGEVYKTDIVLAGQGRPESCSCPYPGSFFCRQHHINEARDQLRSELGQAFTEWQFDSMGEEVCKLWSCDEQLKFNALERLAPVMDHKTFWAVASKHFVSKPRIDLIKYYLNVFLMRRVLSQCRLSLLEIDSDEDEVEEEENEDQPEGSSSLHRTQDVQDVKKVS